MYALLEYEFNKYCNKAACTALDAVLLEYEFKEHYWFTQMKVVALSKSPGYTMIKPVRDSITLLEGLGVEGDAHMGRTVKHRYLVRKNPEAPNLRQVHLMHQELFEELKTKGINVNPGEMGENITTQGIDLLKLPTDTVLHIGKVAQVQIKGLRDPCKQLDDIQPGLMKAMVSRDDLGKINFKTGVMGVVLKGGKLFTDDSIRIEYPQKPFAQLVPV
ncbi:MAG: hypothetical protein JKY54_19715 [Flavobacteriales bacterium]|nr:hypothetical protein [Flavobacteriales bacterium]